MTKDNKKIEAVTEEVTEEAEQVTADVEQAVEEIVEPVAEPVAEEIEPQETRETNIERGLSDILSRLDGVESSIKTLLQPIQSNEPQEQEIQNNATSQTPIPTEPATEARPPAQSGGRKRINLFRGKRQS